ncbi:MAG TPA: hypothetical protein VFK85_01130 [Anaeromyxobacteraceae bacterium]|nr:hypothetical protein [Anaeromyxobacteraceae bacterium]
MTGPALGVNGHTIALFVWASMLVMLLLFLAVVVTLSPPTWASFSVPRDVLLAVVAATSVVGVVAARVVPRHLAPRAGDGRGEITALTRLILGWSLCEAAAIFPLIGFLMTRDWRLLLVFFADVAALVAYCPTRARWERLSRSIVAPAPRSRMVR